MINAVIKQGVSQHLPAIHAAYMTVGNALTEEQQQFVLSQWRTFTEFLKTDSGKIALQTFVSDWQASQKPQ